MKQILKYGLGIILAGFVVMPVLLGMIDIRADKEGLVYYLSYALVIIGIAIAGTAIVHTPRNITSLTLNGRISAAMAAIGVISFFCGMLDPFDFYSDTEDALSILGIILIFSGLGLVAYILLQYSRLRDSYKDNSSSSGASIDPAPPVALRLIVFPKSIFLHIGKAAILFLFILFLSFLFTLFSHVAQTSLTARSIANFFVTFFWMPIFWASRRLYGVKAHKICFWIFIPLVTFGTISEGAVLIHIHDLQNVPWDQLVMPMLAKIAGTLCVVFIEADNFKNENVSNKAVQTIGAKAPQSDR